MKTYQMIELADANGKTYRSKDLFYNKSRGFTDLDGELWGTDAYSPENGYVDGLNAFIHETDWEEYNEE